MDTTASERPSGTASKRAHSFGDRVAGLTRDVDDFVELQMHVPEVRPDDVPMRLLSLQVQLDQVDKDPLQIFK